MAAFDLETFLRVQGSQGQNPFQALGTAFGVPNCLLELTADALSVLPSDILLNLSDLAEDGRDAANSVTKGIVKALMFDTGIIEFDTETGRLKFVSDSAKGKLDNDTVQVLKNLKGIISGFVLLSSAGAQLYSNYQSISQQVNEILNCLQTFERLQSFQSGNSADQKNALSAGELSSMLEKKYALSRQRLVAASEFITKCDKFIDNINTIIQDRQQDPTKEPRISDSVEFDAILAETNYKRFAIDDTGEEPEGDQEGLLRLSFGPPISTRGYFLLTKDGLYYDSQTGGLNPIFVNINSTVVPEGEKWKYEHNSNLGGKGQAITLDQFNQYKNTLFDPDLIDDSPFLMEHYSADHFLRNITEQRDKHIWDLSSLLTDQLAITSNQETSITKNMRLALASEIANHNSKIRRRKKQIEIAVKAPNLFDKTRGEEEIFKKGEVPINDFSYLNDYNFGIEFEKQRALTFRQGEVSGIVLPIETKYASPPIRETDALTINELIVPEIGVGDILYSEPDTSSTILSLTDTVVTDNLFGIYNFLQTKVVQPSSTDFDITNTITNDSYNNVQLVASNPSSIFVSGLSIPYLEGIVKNKGSSPTLASALGSFIRLPDTVEYQELMYNPSGFTIECWVHVPNLTNASTGWLSSTASSLTKAIIANENVGSRGSSRSINATGTTTDLDYLLPDNGDTFVRGVVAGFTRDRRITKESTGYSNSNSDNDPTSSLSFFIAPTQARDLSSCSWINKVDCGSMQGYYKMKVDCSTTVNGKSFGAASSTFVLVDIVGDPQTNQVRMYCDGQLMATSSLGEVFGVREYATPDLPSFKKDNSFEYGSSSVDGPRSLKNGPKLNPFYTPWIVGGGYTDGMYRYGNFMGGDRGGITSGLRGHIGSLKFYSKPLNSSEVLTNYKAQQVYFKNILT